MTHGLLYVTHARIPTEKAHGLQIIKTIEALARIGISVTLVLPKRSNPIREDVYTFYKTRGFTLTYLSDHIFFLESLAKQLYFPLRRLSFGIQSIRFVRTRSERYVYTRDIVLAFFLEILTHKQVIYEDHEPKKSFRLLYRWLLRHISTKVVVAQGLDTLYQSYGISKKSYTIIPNGVDIAEIESVQPDRELWGRQFGIGKDTQVALYVGNLFAWKGVGTLIDAARHLPSTVAVVIIGGTAAESKKLSESISHIQGSPVYFKAYVPHDEVFSFIRAADVLILPNTAREERSFSYTTPIKLFEYMASGVPIVASDIPSLRWYVTNGQSAHLVPPDNAVALAEGVTRILDDRAYADSLARHARAEVRSYTWEERARRIHKLLT